MEMLTFNEFYKLLKAALKWPKERELNDEQIDAVKYGKGPLMIIAGPGSGKTEVLVWRCLKLLLVDRVEPKSIIITTFTEKAANNLINRIISYLSAFMKHMDFKLQEIPDPSLLHVGTLHSICNDIMQNNRYFLYQNKRLMDGFEQRFFLYRYCSICNTHGARYKPGPSTEFWEYFGIGGWQRSSKWGRVNGGISILSRIIEDNLDISKLELDISSNPYISELVKYYNNYRNQLEDNFRCDFAHLQRYFLNFLHDEQGKEFLYGNDKKNISGIDYVLVDEYQDTNPIQEAIYFKLAEKKKNITVVGDDDQAMYRFRGASTDALVNFKDRCKQFLGCEPYPIQLKENYRSHTSIVDLFNEYVFNYPDYAKPGVRAPNKEQMEAKRTFKSDWNPILCLKGNNKEELSKKVVDCIETLKINSYIDDFSQIVLLFRSTREGERGTKKFVDELKLRGIPYFNPRSRMVQKSIEVKQILGALLEIIDPPEDGKVIGKYQENPMGGMKPRVETIQFASECRIEYQRLSNPKLRKYVEDSKKFIENFQKKDKPIRAMNVLKLFYRLISLSPFSEYLNDHVISPRIGILSQLLESFSVTNYNYFIKSNKTNWGLKRNIIGNFYVPFLSLLISQGINDFEDKEFPIPKGYVQIMTYHQAKGLEFPFVFLLDLTSKPRKDSSEHVIEEKFNKYRINPIKLHSIEERRLHDYIRRIYVGKSRAQLGLILCFTGKLAVEAIGFDENSNNLSYIKNLKKKYRIDN